MHLLYFLPVLENILVFFFPPAPSSLNSTHQRVNKVEQGKLKGLKHQNVQGDCSPGRRLRNFHEGMRCNCPSVYSDGGINCDYGAVLNLYNQVSYTSWVKWMLQMLVSSWRSATLGYFGYVHVNLDKFESASFSGLRK